MIVFDFFVLDRYSSSIRLSMKNRVQEDWLSVIPVLETLMPKECANSFSFQHGKPGKDASIRVVEAGT